MAYQPCQLWMPERLIQTGAMTLQPSGAMVATGDKFAFVGRVVHPTTKTGNVAIRKVGFRFGTITKAGGSALTVSLQDVDLTNGPIFRPDGTQDQTVAIANANAAFATSTWLQTGALSADRTVQHGDLLAVVIEYDGAGRLGADSIVLTYVTSASSAANNLDSGSVTALTGGTVWAIAASCAYNNVILEFADGSFGTLDAGFPVSAQASDVFNSASNPEIIGLEFQVPFACKCDGAWANMSAAASADFQVILYDGNTPMVTVSVDANALRATATAYTTPFLWAEQTLAANHTYRVGIKPTTVNSVTLYNYSVNAAGHLQAVAGGTAFQYNTFHTSAWGSPTTTKRPAIGLRLSAVDDGTGAGGGLLVNPGMRGGMI